jgi:hypothetical protein
MVSGDFLNFLRIIQQIAFLPEGTPSSLKYSIVPFFLPLIFRSNRYPRFRISKSALKEGMMRP